jgi:hypothetical protein
VKNPFTFTVCAPFWAWTVAKAPDSSKEVQKKEKEKRKKGKYVAEKVGASDQFPSAKSAQRFLKNPCFLLDNILLSSFNPQNPAVIASPCFFWEARAGPIWGKRDYKRLN